MTSHRSFAYIFIAVHHEALESNSVANIFQVGFSTPAILANTHSDRFSISNGLSTISRPENATVHSFGDDGRSGQCQCEFFRREGNGANAYFTWNSIDYSDRDHVYAHFCDDA